MPHKTRQVRAAKVELVTIPDVELCDVGTWNLSTGVTTFTAEDFVAAVQAQDDPFIRTPKLKIGHTDPRFDGEPCFGKITNLRTKNEGMTLVGDLEGVPSWMAEILPSAYPQRSIEGSWNVKTENGEHSFVITALALLGDTDPGVQTLADLQTLWEQGPVIEEGSPVEAGVRVPIRDGEVDVGKVRAAIHAAANRLKTAASVEVEDVRRSYYETLDSSKMWWWIRAIQIDPPQLIVDDDEGSLYRVEYSIDGDNVTFKDPVEVVVQYQDKTAAAQASKPAVVWASKEESREGAGMDPKLKKLLVAKYGLDEDATDEQVMEALEAEQSETPPEGEGGETDPSEEGGTEDAPTPDPEETPEGTGEGEDVKVPEGMVLVDSGTLEEIRTAASQGKKAHDRQEASEREAILASAIKDGKFAPSRKDHFAKLLKADPEGTKTLLASMAKNVVPVELRGHGTDKDAESTDASAYDPSWLTPKEQARVEAARGGK